MVKNISFAILDLIPLISKVELNTKFYLCVILKSIAATILSTLDFFPSKPAKTLDPAKPEEFMPTLVYCRTSS